MLGIQLIKIIFILFLFQDRHSPQRVADAVRPSGPHPLRPSRLPASPSPRAPRRRHLRPGYHPHPPREQAPLPVLRLQRPHHEHHGLRRHALPPRVHVSHNTPPTACHERDRAAPARAHALHNRRAFQLPPVQNELSGARRRVADRPGQEQDLSGKEQRAYT